MRFLYYFSPKELSKDDLLKKTSGYIEVYMKDDVLTVCFLKSYRKGLGSYLLAYACSKALEKGILNIELDDCSDRCRKSNNIYVKFGMRYEDAYGPEMIGETKEVVKRYYSKVSSSSVGPVGLSLFSLPLDSI